MPERTDGVSVEYRTVWNGVNDGRDSDLLIASRHPAKRAGKASDARSLGQATRMRGGMFKARREAIDAAVLAVLAQGAASAAMLQDVTGFGKAEIRAAVYRLMMRETVESVAPNWKVHQRSVVYQLVEGR